jgi:ATP-dependent Clp protease ATP-binding subunit ClpA
MFEKRYEQLKIASLVRGEEVEGTLEEDLKKVLVEVMYLSGQLEEQIKLLEAKGVTH